MADWQEKSKELAISGSQDEESLGHRLLTYKENDINISAELARNVICLRMLDSDFFHDLADWCEKYNHTIGGLPRKQAIEANMVDLKAQAWDTVGNKVFKSA